MPDAILVVPCFNEAERLDPSGFEAILCDPGIRLLFVDDGSTDTTGELLAALARNSGGRISALSLPHNQGKAEAVRHGLRHALRDEAPIVGYLDADLATPPQEVLRLLKRMREQRPGVLLASRVALLGYDIQRRRTRHYAGRVFATAASLILRLQVYDTQCGMKLFRAGPELAAALEEPFRSRWVFDVELLGRLSVGSEYAAALPLAEFQEEPLRVWHDVPGSKLRITNMLQAVQELALIQRDLAARKARSRRQ